jgi:hypothetical protein
MPQPLAIAGACVAALGVAWLIAWQLISSFRTSDELGIVMAAIAADLMLAAAVFVVVLKKAGTERALGFTAAAIALATLSFSGWSAWMDAVDARSTNPFPSDHRDAEIVLEFLAPGLAGLTVLWRLLVRAHRLAHGQDPRTRWPWFTIAAGLVVVFNPLGINILGSALAHSPSDWLWELWAMMSAAAAVVLVVLGIIEFALRARRLRLPVQAEV